MAWARFDDKYIFSPKIVAAGPWAELLDVRGIIYCAHNETDGFVSVSALALIGRGIPAVKAKARTLIDVGRWLEVDGGYEIHSYLKYNPSHEKLEAEREAARERMKKARNGARGSGEHPPNKQENVTPGSANPVPSRPPCLDSSSEGSHAEHPQPVDDGDSTERARAIVERIIDGQLERANGAIRDPVAYRKKVRADVMLRCIGIPRLARVIDRHPGAPDEMFAAAAVGEPTPYLVEYRVDA